MRLEILGKAGQTIPVDLTAVPVFEHGETAYFVAMFCDLLDVKNLESQVGDLKRELDLCFEDRDRLVQAAAKASHELDQPIQVLLGAVTLMKGRVKQTVPTLVDVVDFLERELSRMVDVVRKTRDLPAFSPAPRRTAMVTAASVSPADGTSEESEGWQSKQPADQTDRVREIQRIASLVVSTIPDDPDSAQNPSGGNP
jgi:signal transduction histidine kinase